MAETKSKQKTAKSSETISVKLPQINKDIWLLPGSILLSAVMISVSIIFAFNNVSDGGVGNNNSGGSSLSLSQCTGDARFTEECYRVFAAEIGADEDDFATCVAEDRYDETVTAEFDYGADIGVGGTPSVYFAQRTGDGIRGFYVAGGRAADLEQIINNVENGSIEDAQKFWQDTLLSSIDDYADRAREYYESEQGGSLSGDELEASVNEAVALQEQDILDSSSLIDLEIGDGVTLGEDNARFIVMEFSDYECPFCQRYAQEQLPTIKENYVDNGTVQFVFRDFPLESIHPNARPAAIAARCAGEQGLYWEFHDIIFEI